MDTSERMRLFLEELTPGVQIGFQGYGLETVHPMHFSITDYTRHLIEAKFYIDGAFTALLPWDRGYGVSREEIDGFPCSTVQKLNPAGSGLDGDILRFGYLAHFFCDRYGPRVDWWVREGEYRFWLAEIAAGGGVEPSI